MTFKRYNEILVAVVGTGFAIAGVAAIITGLVSQWSSNEPETGVVVDKAKAVGEAKLQQRFELCMPSAVSGVAFQYFPVAGVAQDSGGKVAVDYSSYAVSADIRESGADLYSCHLNGKPYTIFNVLIRNAATNEQHLLLAAPAQLDSLSIPDEKCAHGAGRVPCDNLIWGIRNQDNNNDGIINWQDSLRLYTSDLEAGQLHLLSPENASVQDWNWDFKSKEFVLQIKRDSNSDGAITDDDSSEMLIVSAANVASATKIPNDTTAAKLELAFR